MAQSIDLGAARIHLLELGVLLVDMADWLAVPPSARGADAPLFAEPLALPVQSALIQLPGATMLVDACEPVGLAALEPTPRDYRPPDDVVAQLAALGIAPADVSHVVITHRHADHYCGLAHTVDGQLAPCFPHARHFIGRADWRDLQPALADPATLAHRVLTPLARAGLIAPIDGPQQIGAATIFPSPGETPGHLSVRLAVGGRIFYAIGDLYHHPIELARPEWLVRWADPDTTARSRAAQAHAALGEDAMLLATHIAGFGRLRATAGQIEWETL